MYLKAVTTEKERSLVNRRRRNRIDPSRRAEFNRRLDIFARGPACRARLDARFDKATDVVEMIDNRLGELFRKSFFAPNDVVT
jgi:hypothetical protein